MTRTGTGGRTRNHRAPGGPAGPVREWPGDRQTRGTSAAKSAGSAGSAGTRPPGQGHGGREAHRWSCGPAAGPARAGIQRRPPRGARPSGRPRWPRPPRASRRAARSSSPVPGVRPGPGGLPRAAGPPRAPGTPRGPGPARSVRCFPAPRSARRVPGRPPATGRGHRLAARPRPARPGPAPRQRTAPCWDGPACCSARVWSCCLRNDAAAGCVTRLRFTRAAAAISHGADPRSRQPPPGSRPAAVNRGARPPGPPRDCGPPAGPRPGCPARRPPGAG